MTIRPVWVRSPVGVALGDVTGRVVAMGAPIGLWPVSLNIRLDFLADLLTDGSVLAVTGNLIHRDDGSGTTNGRVVDTHGTAARMAELLTVLEALWRLHEGPVHYDDRFYHVYVSPTGDVPEPVRARIPVWIADVNPLMLRTAGDSDALVAAVTDETIEANHDYVSP